MVRSGRTSRSRAALGAATAGIMALALVALTAPNGAAESGERAAAPDGTHTYIVQMSLDPVVAYDGGVAGLAATEPVGSRKVDPASDAVVDSASPLLSVQVIPSSVADKGRCRVPCSPHRLLAHEQSACLEILPPP